MVDVIVVWWPAAGSLYPVDGTVCRLENPRDTEEVEVFLADDKKRENFYNLLCALGKALNIVLNAEQTYAAVPKMN